MAVVETPSSHDEPHVDHAHPEFIAHHFDNAEQQFDSGKLGIWIFLVTEVLFFSGLFVAYTLYRAHHPEIFDQAHVFLDKVLGGLNTVVLLFSSLTMALAVRAAQLGRNKNCAVFILITMVCAAMFLGVKAVEYSHKWDMGIFVRSGFNLTYAHAEPQTGIGQSLHISDYLVYLSIIPTLLLAGFAVGGILAKLNGKNVLATFMGGMVIMLGGYFAGVVGGQIYMKATEGGGGGHAMKTPLILHAATPLDENSTEAATSDVDGAEDHASGSMAHEEPPEMDRDVGIFFSIYYCMTGLHAIHIIAGIIALAWIFWRCLLGHWRSDYFGPVDYVGLYWHLVDLIWIYLFPLLYLID